MFLGCPGGFKNVRRVSRGLINVCRVSGGFINVHRVHKCL